jgi:hypothetical protein
MVRWHKDVLGRARHVIDECERLIEGALNAVPPGMVLDEIDEHLAAVMMVAAKKSCKSCQTSCAG